MLPEPAPNVLLVINLKISSGKMKTFFYTPLCLESEGQTLYQRLSHIYAHSLLHVFQRMDGGTHHPAKWEDGDWMYSLQRLPDTKCLSFPSSCPWKRDYSGYGTKQRQDKRGPMIIHMPQKGTKIKQANRISIGSSIFRQWLDSPQLEPKPSF